MKIAASILLYDRDNGSQSITSSQADIIRARSWIAHQRARYGEYPDGDMIAATIERLRERGWEGVDAEPDYTWSAFMHGDS